jgi:hypothetical protein
MAAPSADPTVCLLALTVRLADDCERLQPLRCYPLPTTLNFTFLHDVKSHERRINGMH